MIDEILKGAQIAKVTNASASGATFHFGSNKVKHYTKTFPCGIWRVIVEADGKTTYGLTKELTLRTREDRRAKALAAAVREAGRGWRPGSKDQWVEVRPLGFRPPEASGGARSGAASAAPLEAIAPASAETKP